VVAYMYFTFTVWWCPKLSGTGQAVSLTRPDFGLSYSMNLFSTM